MQIASSRVAPQDKLILSQQITGTGFFVFRKSFPNKKGLRQKAGPEN
jgi:hypothetical protein